MASHSRRLGAETGQDQEIDRVAEQRQQAQQAARPVPRTATTAA